MREKNDDQESCSFSKRGMCEGWRVRLRIRRIGEQDVRGR